MFFEVEIKDAMNRKRIQKIKFNLLKFIKHFGFAGMANNPNYMNYLKGIGAFMFYLNYLHLSPTGKLLGFKKPNKKIYDPTEKSHFSNLLGKAIADYLSREISNSIISINYESAMLQAGHFIKGGRPDLYCLDKGNKQFAIECKGYSRKTVSDNDMSRYKNQSQLGPLKVNFSVASVTYNSFRRLKVKYYDPINDNYPYNRELNPRLISSYFKGILDILDNSNNVSTERIAGEEFYSINDLRLLNLGRTEFNPKILITRRVETIIKTEFIERNFSRLSEEQSYYIDTDGVGIIV